MFIGNNFPGQPWACYRSTAFEEHPKDKDLAARLTDLLTPTTTREELRELTRAYGETYNDMTARGYLRLKQKQLDRDEWLVDDKCTMVPTFP